MINLGTPFLLNILITIAHLFYFYVFTYIFQGVAMQYFNIQAASLNSIMFMAFYAYCVICMNYDNGVLFGMYNFCVCVLATPHRYVTTCRIENDRYTISNVFPFFAIRYYNLLAGTMCTLCLR
jgi:hypothetical protein